MTRDRLLLALGTVTAVAAGLLLGAAPASAASYTLNLTMDDSTCVVTAPATQTLQTGDSVTITNTTSSVLCSLKIQGTSNLTGWTQAFGALTPVSIAGTSSNFVSLWIQPSITFVVGTVSADIYTMSLVRVSTVATYSSSGGGGGSGGSSNSSSTSAGNSGPTSVLQQFAKPTTGTCDAAQPTGLNWSGVASGGWSESWAQWANGGRGGSVCTRTLGYSSGWAVVN
jgi:hypothetical protein